MKVCWAGGVEVDGLTSFMGDVPAGQLSTITTITVAGNLQVKMDIPVW